MTKRYGLLSDDQLVKIILKNTANQDAWEELYNRLSSELISIILYYIKGKDIIDPGDSADIMHDVFLTFYQKVINHEITPDIQIRPYLRRAARNRIIDVIRRWVRFENIVARIDAPSILGIATDNSSPEAKSIKAETLEMLESAITQLKAREQEAIKLRILGYSIKESADIMDQSRDSVNNILYRAIHKLKRIIEKNV